MSRSFDAVDDQINCGGGAVLTNLVKSTFAAWIKPRIIGGDATPAICGKHASSSSRRTFSLSDNTASATLKASIVTTGTTLIKTGATPIPFNAWTFVAMSWNGGLSSASSNLRLWINAVEDSYSSSQDGTNTIGTDGGGNFYIGCRFSTDQTFNGLISHLHFYNSFLTQNELRQLMFNPGSIQRGLVGYWPLTSPAAAAQDSDYSGNRNTGVPNGGVARSTDEPPISNMWMPRRFSRNSYVIPAVIPPPPSTPVSTRTRRKSRMMVGVGL